MIDRDSLVSILSGYTSETGAAEAADAILAFDKPDPRLRAVLLESLPADARWEVWVDGVLERLR